MYAALSGKAFQETKISLLWHFSAYNENKLQAEDDAVIEGAHHHRLSVNLKMEPRFNNISLIATENTDDK